MGQMLCYRYLKLTVKATDRRHRSGIFANFINSFIPTPTRYIFDSHFLNMYMPARL